MRAARLITGLTVFVSACGFEHGSLSPDARIDGPPPDSPPRQASCAAIKAMAPTSTTGTYVIDPDGMGGNPEITVGCDMTIDGGGWMVIFQPTSSNVQSPAAYTVAPNSLFTTATQLLIAYRPDAAKDVTGTYAIMAFPQAWRAASPFSFPGTDLTTDVIINTNLATPMTVRYGNQSFTSTCSDPWQSSTWGRFCIQGSQAPFFSGFYVTAQDACADSTQAWSATDCSAKRFTLAIR